MNYRPGVVCPVCEGYGEVSDPIIGNTVECWLCDDNNSHEITIKTVERFRKRERLHAAQTCYKIMKRKCCEWDYVHEYCGITTDPCAKHFDDCPLFEKEK